MPPRKEDEPFMMPIEGVHQIKGIGTVVTGKVERGKVKTGETLEIKGIKKAIQTTCTGVESFKKQVKEGITGDNLGLLLRGTDKTQVKRGMFAVKPGSIDTHTKLAAEFFFKTADITGALKLKGDRELIVPGGNVSLEVDLRLPAVCWKGMRFFMREGAQTI